MLTDPETPCVIMPTRECFGLCDVTGYCFRFPWRLVQVGKQDD